MEGNAQSGYTYLALGDSYTIGESVPIYQTFPYQLVSQLRAAGLNFHAPEIVARTGWTTGELMLGVAQSRLQPQYDWVTLLIGVNNQYRGKDQDEYRKEFEQLLQQAISFSGNRKNRVIVLSIPDWGATPFAKSRDRVKITTEIDTFNRINKEVSHQYAVHYIPITELTRAALQREELVAQDGLHPSGMAYKEWAELIAKIIVLNTDKANSQH